MSERATWLPLLLLGLAGCGRIGFDAMNEGGGDGGGNDDGASGGSAAPATSCMGLSSTCGFSGNGSCCDSPVVGGGVFHRGYDAATDGMFQDNSRPATISPFRLDKYEVTVGRFRKFVTAGLGTQAKHPAADAGARTLNGIPNQGGWNPAWNANLPSDTTALIAAVKCGTTNQYTTWTDSPGANENRPMVCIDWYEAMAFCVWDGGFLPTEAEWNYAATGGSLQRAYPWSNAPSDTNIDCSITNYGGANWPATACVGSGSTNVGVMPMNYGLWDHADLGGNVWEWVLDWYATPYQMPCTDCANLSPSPRRAFRGGSFVNDAWELRANLRSYDDPTIRYSNAGVRCARRP